MIAAATHLTPDNLESAQRHLVAKAIAEFSHERLLAPERHGDGWRIETPLGGAVYLFDAERTELEHWVIDGASLRRLVDGDKRVSIHGDEVAVRAKIHTLGGFSAHAGKTDLLAWYGSLAAGPVHRHCSSGLKAPISIGRSQPGSVVTVGGTPYGVQRMSVSQ